jgi:hypothetical protein
VSGGCERCGEPTKRPGRRFCSNQCHLLSSGPQRAASRSRPRPPCPVCGSVDVARGATCCSRRCSDIHRRKAADPCARCGSTDRDVRNRRGPYCSWACFNEDRYHRTGGFAKWVEGWVSGAISGTTEQGRPDHRVRQALVFIRGQRCEACGWAQVNPVSGRVPLHVDHVHGDRARNRPEDVRLLCPNCHSLTPNYQHLNNPDVSPVRARPSRRYREIWLSSTAR